MSVLRYHEFNSFTDWVQESAQFIYNNIKTAYLANNQPIVCLAGGNTPVPVYYELCSYLYKALGNHPEASALPVFEKSLAPQKPLIIIPGDERITPDIPHSLSNRNETMLRKAFQALLTSDQAKLVSWYTGHIGCNGLMSGSDDTNLEFVNTNRDSSQLCKSMNDYINKLKQFRSPLFDCVVLGVGSDGHLAGIFDATAPALHEQTAATAPFTAPTEPRQRVSLLPHILRDSASTLILMHKHGKEAVIKTILEEEHILINESICQHAELYCYTGAL